jgi:putative nucleotidyltransferase with HDIG domain
MSDSTFRVRFYVSLLAALAAAYLLRADWTTPAPTSQFYGCLAALLLMALLSEAGSLRLPVGTTTTSVSFVPYLAAVVLIGPTWAMALAGVNVFVAETAFRRKPPIKVAHNAAKEVVAVGTCGGLYVLLGGTPSMAVFSIDVPAFLLSVPVLFAINVGATALAISLSTGIRVKQAWHRLHHGNSIYDIAASTLSILLAFLYIQLGLKGFLIVFLPLLFVRYLLQITLQLEQTNRDLLELVVKSIEARDPYTSGHSVRVSKFAEAVSQELGLSSRQVERIATAALLHDVGKIYEEYGRILRKNGKLDASEMQAIRSHPLRSAELVGTISSLRGEVQQTVRHHHESYDGTGYPDGLAGDVIPLGSRIIAIADTVDAMTTTRPYRDALAYPLVARELQSRKGVQYDPKLVDLFCSSARVAALVDEFFRERAEGFSRAEPDRVEAEVPAAFGSDGRRAATGVPSQRPRWGDRERVVNA